MFKIHKEVDPNLEYVAYYVGQRSFHAASRIADTDRLLKAKTVIIIPQDKIVDFVDYLELYEEEVILAVCRDQLSAGEVIFKNPDMKTMFCIKYSEYIIHNV